MQGMHCSACEVLIERAFRNCSQVTKVKANQNGWVDVWSTGQPDLLIINETLSGHGYKVLPNLVEQTSFSFKKFGAILLVVTATYLLFKKFNLVPNLAMGEDLSWGVVFIMGLVAAVSSCIAVTGGLLVAVSAANNQAHPNISGWQKFKPHIYFNLGRVLGYTLLGAAVGALGSLLSFSTFINGLIIIIASAAMIVLGLKLLNFLPWFSNLHIRPPKFIAHKLYNATGSPKPWAPFMLGVATFFLPCGFTQALQLYVLTRGEALVGGLTMLIFSLGTLPALVGLGAIISFVKGRWQYAVTVMAGAMVVTLGFINFGYGANLTGLSSKIAQGKENLKILSSQRGLEINDPNVVVENGVQVVKMEVVARGYSPNSFTIRAGLPVRWEIDGVNTYGCQSILQFPALDLTTYVKPGKNIIEFTPQGQGLLPFHCAMGMYTGSFTVLPEKGS